jgi:hypothetical protein
MPDQQPRYRSRPGRMSAAAWGALACLVALLAAPLSARGALLDDFEDLSAWSTGASEGVNVELAQDEGQRGMAMRVDFDFKGHAGYLIARKQVDWPLPDDYQFTFYIRGDAPENNLEIKFIDASGQNVWWASLRHFEFSQRWRKVTVKKRHIEFAWGPDRSELKEVAQIEFAIAAGRGGAGSVWIDQLSFAERDLEPYDLTPELKASTSAESSAPAAVLDGDPATSWHSGTVSEEQWLLIDFEKVREYGGLVIDWGDEDFATTYDVEISDDEREWQHAFRVEAGNGGRDYLYLPETDSRYLRLNLKRSARGAGYAIKSIDVKPYQFATSPNSFFAAIAKDAPRGDYPRYYADEQSYWTVAGVKGDFQKALIDETGTVEPGEGWGSIEPFLYLDEGLVTWNDVVPIQELEQGYLPVPSVTWTRPSAKPGARLKITALAAGPPGRSSLWLRYRISNESAGQLKGRLFLALRPFRVNPPWQTLNGGGGVIRTQELSYGDGRVSIDRDRTVIPLSGPDGFGAARFEDGSITDYLRAGALPQSARVLDNFGYASGALEYDFDLAAGQEKDVFLIVPLHEESPAPPPAPTAEDAQRLWAETFDATVRDWHSTLDRVAIELPGDGQRLVDSLKTTLAYILINADGAALHPGPRAYKRSWIRDGALISAALLRVAHPEEVRAFIEWYAGYQFESGAIPCCVDDRGADLAVEHDSHGQWLYLLAEYYRFSRDVGLLTEMWPSVVRVVDYIDQLRQKRRTAEYETAGKRMYYGMVPESISHEGYIQNPVHSYWDGLFVLLGLKDATRIATILGEDERAAAFARIRDEFRADLYASMAQSMKRHNITYIPGAAELGDFDFTSTAIAADPVGELRNLPEPAFAETFAEYWRYFTARKNDQNDEAQFERYTPYEFRIVGPLIRMGLKQQAHEVLNYLFEGQRPSGWNSWAEVVWRDPRVPGFIGDMPHSWVGAEYIRSVRTLFAYEREGDRALVLGAGLLPGWALKGEGVSVRRLPTHFGTLNYSVGRGDGAELVVSIGGDISMPPGRIVVRSPLEQPLVGVSVNDHEIESFTDREAVIDRFPAKVVLRYAGLPAVAEEGGGSQNPVPKRQGQDLGVGEGRES